MQKIRTKIVWLKGRNGLTDLFCKLLFFIPYFFYTISTAYKDMTSYAKMLLKNYFDYKIKNPHPMIIALL